MKTPVNMPWLKALTITQLFFLSFMDNHLLSSSTSSAGLLALDVTSDPSQGCPTAGARSPERLFARSHAGVA